MGKKDKQEETEGKHKVEPPGLFRGRGEHPKMDTLKVSIQPEDITINMQQIPVAPKGDKWRKVKHEDSDLGGGPGDEDQTERSGTLLNRQGTDLTTILSVLALRAGSEKEENETANSVGCCSLRVGHITLHQQKGGQEFMVEFDFLGKDSIRYYNEVFKNLKIFMENKEPDDDVFDRINPRTFNASTTLQEQLNKLTSADMSLLSYNRANRAVAILCNHQRAAPNTVEKSMQGKVTGMFAFSDLCRS
ncbi:unnamed protein product [Coregonus sp. 'balchen']|nr:unnamed protein product [Coregonus sp. 'balchen']